MFSPAFAQGAQNGATLLNPGIFRPGVTVSSCILHVGLGDVENIPGARGLMCTTVLRAHREPPSPQLPQDIPKHSSSGGMCFATRLPDPFTTCILGFLGLCYYKVGA